MEIVDIPLIQKVARTKKPIIISTGTASLEEIEEAVDAARGYGCEDLTLLVCSSSYPAKPSDVHLARLGVLKNLFGVRVGYSDHTEGVEAAIAAVALGATIIEKHLTLDRGMAGPDHLASANPEEFARMVSSLRAVEQALGSQEKAPTASEVLNRDVVRKSVVAVRPIKVGEVFSVENIGVKRPGTGLSPMRWHEILGCVADRDFDVDDVIEMP
jgi:N,N'-diacetyllegionaminate synthase